MVLSYEEAGRFLNGHDRGITKVSFSPEGNYLATAGLDGRVCVWDVESRHLLHSFNGSCPVLSLVWIPPSEDIILCGLQDGNMAILKMTPEYISVAGFWAHAYPVECLALNSTDNRLASGAHRELLVWKWDENTGKFRLDNTVPEPLKLGWNQSDEEIVTSVHWTSPAGSPALLLVTYLHHGILLIDTVTGTRLRTVNTHGQIASASLSEDGMRLAICDTTRGYHIYCMRTGAWLADIDYGRSEDTRPKPVLFIHGGLALLGGGTTGELRVWDVIDTVTGGPTLNVPESEDTQPTVMHTLPLPRRSKALAVGAYYREESDEFFIAAGVMNETSPSVCVLWTATEREGGHHAGRIHSPTSSFPRSLAWGALVALGGVLIAYVLYLAEVFGIAGV